MKTLYLILFTCLGYSSPLFGQLTISEYSASNLSDFIDQFGKYEDWIEVYNTGSTQIVLSDWYLSDKMDNPEKWSFPEEVFLAPGEYEVVFCSGRDGYFSNEIHSNFKLSQTTGKDILTLSKKDGSYTESTNMIITYDSHSVMRGDSDSEQWLVSKNPSFKGPVEPTSPSFLRYANKPTIEQKAGFYEDEIEITIINNEPNSILRITTDGKEVTSTSSLYSGPFSVSNTRVIKARSFSNEPDIIESQMDFATFFIDESFTLPVFSIASDSVQFLANGNGELLPVGSLEYFNLEKERESAVYGSLNRHGKDSWALAHRSLDWITRDEYGYAKAVNAQLYPGKKRDEFQRLMFRASGDDNYPARPNSNSDQNTGSTHLRDEYVHTLALEGGMKLDVRTVQRAIVFLNGDYWGLYGLREKIADHDYTKEYYDQGKYDLEFFSTWGGTIPTYGGSAGLDKWSELQSFILDNDMALPSNYNLVDSLINLTSMVDWMLINTNTVAADWLQWNTGWWRGLDPDGDHKKYGYIVWDLDATFDFYINYTGIPNVNYDAWPCDIRGAFVFSDVSRHHDIFFKLLDENDSFRELYTGRYADMMNTTFTCDFMLSLLDRMIGVIAPEMPRQIERWGGSMTEWESNVQDLRTFIENRCEYIPEALMECDEELSGPYQLTLMTEPVGIGEIDFNSLDIEEFPWQGSYYQGVENKIKAKVFDEFEDEYEFVRWETSSGENIYPSIFDRKAKYEITDQDTLTAIFGLKTNTKEFYTQQNLRVYPNPTRQVINVNFNLGQKSRLVTVKLISILGQNQGHHLSQIENVSGKQSMTFDLSGLNISSGIYFLELNVDGNTTTKKVSFIE